MRPLARVLLQACIVWLLRKGLQPRGVHALSDGRGMDAYLPVAAVVRLADSQDSGCLSLSRVLLPL